MKGAKGGNRDRIISWLFSEKTRKLREEYLEEQEKEEQIIDEKRKERRKDKSLKDKDEPTQTVDVTEVIEVPEQEKKHEDRKDKDKKHTEVKQDETKEQHEEVKDDHKDKEKDESVVHIYPSSKDKPKEEKENQDENLVEVPEVPEVTEVKDKEPIKPPTLFAPEDVVKELKEQNREKQEEISTVFPGFEEIQEITDKGLEKPELVRISVIEEINRLLYEDNKELQDIKYKIEVLNKQEQDEVLLENIEKIKRELEELVKRFEEIRKKYDYLYGLVDLRDISYITGLNVGDSINDYIVNIKEGKDGINTIDQIKEIEEYIAIINGIIEIEKHKDLLNDSIDNKLVDFNIRDDEFIALQDEYANLEYINRDVDKYNYEIAAIIKDMNEKIANSVDVSREIETTTRIVPDVNRMVHATMLLTASSFIPPTPLGQLFKTGLAIEATTMMATAFRQEEHQREITHTTVIDYSTDILINKDTLNTTLDSIDNAFGQIEYMKDMFDKKLSLYKSQIPEYDELIKNILYLEKELTASRNLVINYNKEMDEQLALNKEKQKVMA